ncbi:inositol-3-phosphate synthase [Streptantibioticus parmotrematis]|uniref:inositol-3-phosphate synthase n=1 Tax=Streptantibioticus parmotrematis TaxID=2873249 RepID=UPI0027E1B0CD|nr:inositol-3-phosphate synthase [Streptantibioticus parmotrematis]
MSAPTRTGVWLVGACGSVATTTVVGAAAIRAGLAAPTGCVSELPAFRTAGLPPLEDLVLGGHDLTVTPLAKRAELLAQAGVLPAALLPALAPDLAAADAWTRPVPQGMSQRRLIEALADDITAFRTECGLDRVVVVNVATTEPHTPPHPAWASAEALRDALAADEEPLPYSSVHACAALRAGCGYVDFTPSTGCRVPALHELATASALPYAGSDGKTGETLVKSVLAPMFDRRALRVRAWSGTNLLGGGDGAALAEPERARSKTESKSRVLREGLGYGVDGDVHIHHVPALGDWKTAWDHIAFDGFLGVRMSMQFVWQGCDSALAAPLVLDLARFTALAHRAGVAGPVAELGFFFKDPVGSDVHGLEEQFERLRTWATSVGGAA